jgi:dTDP-glucose 4,6-dehydratase
LVAKQPSALVTGAAGFLGSFVTDRLIETGYTVLGVDNLFRGKMAHIAHLSDNPAFRFERLDLTGAGAAAALSGLMDDAQVQVVYHLAAVNGTQYFYDRPGYVFATNIEATQTVLAAMNTSPGVEKIVYTSSSEVYGDPMEIPTPETHPVMLRPDATRDSYAASKAFGEFAIRHACDERDVAWVVLRLFNCYGERMDSTKYGQVVPELVRKALGDQAFTLIGDGSQTRSFCYAADAARLIVAAGEAMRNEVVNVGNDAEVTILALAKLIHEIVDRPFAPEFLPGRADDHTRRRPDITRLIERTGERPLWDLRSGVERVVADIRANAQADG